jgi:tol-pal system protein YbgF
MRRLTASLLALALVLPLACGAGCGAGARARRWPISARSFRCCCSRCSGCGANWSPPRARPRVSAGGSVLERVDAIESELRRLTARTEELEFRIERIVTDGTNRIGDLEFRLVELEGGDLGALAATPPLGGETPERGLGQPAPPPGAGEAPLLAVGEQDDFDRARAALDAGDYDAAVERFAAFVETYTGGPLTAEAHFLRGRAHAGQGATTAAARAWLDAFNADPNGARAAESLMRLGQALGELGQVEEGCLMLDEVGARFPGSDMVAPAAEARRALSCP